MPLIDGLAIGGYRSLQTEPLTHLAPLAAVNFVAGQNNTGKSNLLRFIHVALADQSGAGDTDAIGNWDRPLADQGSHRFRFGLGVAPESMLEDSRLERIRDEIKQAFVDRLSGLPRMRSGESDLVWWEFAAGQMGPVRQWPLDDAFLADLIGSAPQDLHDLAAGISSTALSTSGGGRGADLGRVLPLFAPSLAALPPARTIVAFRQILPSGDEAQDARNGLNLVRKLRAIQNPAMDRRPDRKKFDAITTFVRTVLEDEHVHIEIPHDLSSILITKDGATLPLENLGTGIHEVVIIAAAATLVENSVVCVEEPEIHLHPLLQRKLVRFLARSTSNQYFIATHSASMLDSDLGSVFHVRLEDGYSSVTHAASPHQQAAIAADMGYRSSDLIQANAIVWVEGPSDRIYIRHWIELLDPELIEGVHFSIMFYGGRLLSHLSSNDPDVDDFISLRRLNRNMAIVIDSDRVHRAARLSGTKIRVRDEFNDSAPGLAWVTAGYTVENYVPHGLLRPALGRARTPLSAAGRFENPLSASRAGSSPDKVKIARTVVATWTSAEDWPLDLRARVAGLVRFIRQANAS